MIINHHFIKVLNHGDLGPDHIFLEKNKIVGVIDPGNSFAGPAEYDLAYFAVYVNEYQFKYALDEYDEVLNIKYIYIYMIVISVNKAAKAQKIFNYENGDIIRLYDIDYSIHISLDSEATLGKIKLLNKEIWITIPNNKEYDRQKLIKHLLIKGCQKFFKPRLSHRVLELNTKYFEKEISTIKLKYNKSNWGSCSSSKNLNFSVRLLLAPSEVIDYVIIHELTHLVEMNHSDRFWSIVSKIVPSYKESEKFLKMYNHSLDF
ncbi:MAG TPA: DUF45 domain-containing protein [Agitococcus sp.]|nr:DUF45 domain-containing protein [Agitococcus sp.]